MTSLSLLIRRVKENIMNDYRLIKTVIDWTVLVYIIVPLTVISAVIYRSWWLEIPHWMVEITINHLFILFFLFLFGGHFLTYVRDADRIFLKKNNELFIGLKQKGIILSYMLEIFLAVLLCVLIAPFWFKQYESGLLQLFLFGGLWFSLKWFIMAVKGRLNVELRGWRALIRGVPLFIVALFIWIASYQLFMKEYVILLVLLIMMNTFISFFVIRPRYTSVHTFEQDLMIDELRKNKHIELIFGLSMDVEKLPTPRPPRKSPRLYSKSNRLFRQRNENNGFLELFIKVTTRDMQYVREYVQIIGITSVAIVILPSLWLKIVVTLSGCLFLSFWVSNTWDRVIGRHPFTKQYVWKDGFFKAKRIVTTFLMAIFILIIIFLFIWNSFIQNLFNIL